MKNIASLFSDRARTALRESLGITLSDDRDYSQNELEQLYERITDEFPYSFDSDGSPQEPGMIFDEIIDTFCENKLPM